MRLPMSGRGTTSPHLRTCSPFRTKELDTSEVPTAAWGKGQQESIIGAGVILNRAEVRFSMNIRFATAALAILASICLAGPLVAEDIKRSETYRRIRGALDQRSV
jgi:hypothetical protein